MINLRKNCFLFVINTPVSSKPHSNKQLKKRSFCKRRLQSLLEKAIFSLLKNYVKSILRNTNLELLC